MNRWAPGSHHLECRVSLEVVQRSIYRARARMGLGQVRICARTAEDVRDKMGNSAHYPSDDKLIPPVSHETLAPQVSFPI